MSEACSASAVLRHRLSHRRLRLPLTPYLGPSPHSFGPSRGFLRRAERGRLRPQAEVALRNAAIRGDLATLKRLVGEGVDVNAKDENGFTALARAAAEGKLDCLELLIAKGAKLDATANTKWTALHRAAFWGHAPCVEALLKAGADARLKTEKGETALDHAKKNGHTQVIALLENAAAKG